MTEYHKIDTIYKRDRRGQIIEGDWSRPEFEYLAELQWDFTEKVDGTNIRMTYSAEWSTPETAHRWIAGRTDNAQIPPHLLDRLIDIYRAAPWTDVFATEDPINASDVTLYGEGYGAKIQKGGGNYKADGCDFVLFDVKIGNWWLTRDAVMDVGQKLSIDTVPLLGTGTIVEAVEMARAGFMSPRWPGVMSEGLVIRPHVDLSTRGGERIIAKVKHRDFT